MPGPASVRQCSIRQGSVRQGSVGRDRSGRDRSGASNPDRTHRRAHTGRRRTAVVPAAAACSVSVVSASASGGTVVVGLAVLRPAITGPVAPGVAPVIQRIGGLARPSAAARNPTATCRRRASRNRPVRTRRPAVAEHVIAGRLGGRRSVFAVISELADGSTRVVCIRPGSGLRPAVLTSRPVN